MEFRRRQIKAQGKRVVLVPGSYNPPTHAHRALLEAALEQVDEAVAVMPRTFPHKSYHGVALEGRIRMLEQMSLKPYSIAISKGGLFLEMCEEFQAAAGRPVDLFVACGRDAAERILTWDYADPQALDRMFENFQLLVAARQGDFDSPPRFRHRIHQLVMDPVHDAASSSAVRELVRARLPWSHLVPEGVAPLVDELYR